MPRGKIRVGKYDFRSKVEPTTPSFTNVLIHTSGPLSPYTMKDDDGVIMETYWQASKIWKTVKAQKQPISTYHDPKVYGWRWEHPAEVHWDETTKEPTLAYWAWREKLFNHPKWVRYPAGYYDHGKALGSLILSEDGTEYEMVGYIEARKRIYFAKYREIGIKTAMFKNLLKRHLAGENLQINEVDGPRFTRNDYPYDLVENGSIPISSEILEALINNPNQPFGHGYSVAAMLLGIEEFEV